MKNPDQPVVFIPFTAPGDEVECQITSLKKNYAEGELVEVLSPSPERVTPRCPYFGVCGGCQLQHLNYETQVDHKRNVVQDALKRVYPDVKVSISKADPIWEYRRHITLTLKEGKLGYYALDNRTVIPVKECPIFTSKEDPIFDRIQHIASCCSGGKVKILKTVEHTYIAAFHFKEIPPRFWHLAEDVLQDPLIGILANGKGKGITETQIVVEGTSFTVDPFTFLQVHPEQSREIYAFIKNYMAERKPHLLLDLYCGMGISTVLAAPYVEKVIGVERNGRAIERAKAHKIPHVHFLAKDVEEALPSLLRQKPDTALVNPPREGLDKRVARQLAESSLLRILYISCQPATLARDLQVFKDKEFKLKWVQAFDMFPQTGHVETLVVLERDIR